MALGRQSFAGGAAKCTAGSAVGISATTITLVGDTSGWPTGASGRPFIVALDRGVAGKMEKVLCSALTGSTLTITQRGYDGTNAVDHDANCDIEHSIGATVFDDYGRHVYDLTGDDHEQYVPVDTTLRGFSDVSGIVGTPVNVSGANAEGSADTLSRSDHVHAIGNNAVTNAAIADDAVTATKIAAGAVGNSELGDNAVSLAKMGDSSVDTPELVDGAVTTAKLEDASVTSAKIVDATIVPADVAAGGFGGVLDAAVTGGPVGGGAVTLATLVIAAQPFAYTLDASAFWSAMNSDSGDTFSFTIKVDGVNKGQVVNRHAGGANVDHNYSIPCITLVSVPASTGVTVTVASVRETSHGAISGTLTQTQAGRLVVKLYPKGPVT